MGDAPERIWMLKNSDGEWCVVHNTAGPTHEYLPASERDAAVAAAYEAAEKVARERYLGWQDGDGTFLKTACADIADAIRARATDEQRNALAEYGRQMKAEGLREAAEVCTSWHHKALVRVAYDDGLDDVEIMNHEATASTAGSLAHEFFARAAEIEKGEA